MYGEFTNVVGDVHVIPFPCGPNNSGIVAQAWLNLTSFRSPDMVQIRVRFSSTGDTLKGQNFQLLHDEVYNLTDACRLMRDVPANTDIITMEVVQGGGKTGWSLELKAK